MVSTDRRSGWKDWLGLRIVFNLLSWTVFDEDLMLHCWISGLFSFFYFFRIEGYLKLLE